jgi:multicomponent Na+:H+ antiporter subunit D
VGYLILALSLNTPIAIAAGIFYLVHLMISKTNLLLISSVVEDEFGNGNLNQINSLLKTHPFLALQFLISALSLAGLPPLSGFFSKFFLAQATLDNGEYFLLFIIFAVSMLTLLSMLKIWNHAFWDKNEGFVKGVKEKRNNYITEYFVIGFFNLLLVLMGLYSSKIFTHAQAASQSLFYINESIEKILGVSL